MPELSVAFRDSTGQQTGVGIRGAQSALVYGDSPTCGASANTAIKVYANSPISGEFPYTVRFVYANRPEDGEFAYTGREGVSRGASGALRPWAVPRAVSSDR